MISGKTIICLASGWDYHPTSKHHIMRELSKQNHVIWVNWHASRRPGVAWSDLRHIVSRLGQIRQGARQVSDAITVLTPWQVPLPGWRLAGRFNALMVRRAVHKILGNLPPMPVQIWSFAPDVAELIGNLDLDEELIVYYCVDAFGEFPGYDRELIERLERELLSKCDLVITTSRPLYEKRQRLHSNIHLLQHGVDHAHLSRALHGHLPIPPELRDLPRPILGYVGVIGSWVNLDLVAGLAQATPNASVVLVGPEQTSRGPCAGLPNVHWLGPRAHQVLPNYLRCFDVGLIPFRHVPLAYNANPIKLYEYLAAGVPVVSTSLPAVELLPGAVWLADDVGETVACCAQAIEQNREADRRSRSELMRAESWSARLEHISNLVAATLGEHPGTGSAEGTWAPKVTPARQPAPVGVDCRTADRYCVGPGGRLSISAWPDPGETGRK